MLHGEPTSGRDPELVREVLDISRMLARRSDHSVIVTHEMAFARQVANRLVVRDDGRIVGPPAGILGSPREERTRRLLQRFTPGG